MKRTATGIDPRTRMSILWVVVMLNMLAADVLSFMYPGSLKEIMSGYGGEVLITPGFLLVAAIIMEIPIAMIYLSRVLTSGANRWANTIAGIVTIAFVVGGGSGTLHYLFLAAVEIVCMLAIIWLTWRRTGPEGQPA